MNSFYKEHSRFFVSVDCLVFGFAKGQLNLLVCKRKMEPAQGTWSLPGGFIEENESAEAAAERVLSNLTGLENIYMEQLKMLVSPDAIR
jgi:ADP-ribose pyrophosphatase YjhB (NUDIX family)